MSNTIVLTDDELHLILRMREKIERDQKHNEINRELRRLYPNYNTDEYYWRANHIMYALDMMGLNSLLYQLRRTPKNYEPKSTP
jgi:hypothetical protein